jgi:UDP-GlcNAc:undecaprenyl-phosphate GlcNAc-1-phosphate transferase
VKQSAKVTLLHMDVRMLRAQDAQEQPFADGNEATVRKRAVGRFFPFIRTGVDLLLVFLLAMSVTMALIPPLMRVAARWNFLDAPGQRKVHTAPVPRVGGIAMAAGTLAALALAGNFAQPMPAYLAGVIVLLVFGVWDDRKTLAAGPKALGQVIAVLIVMTWGDVSVNTLTLTERHAVPDWIGLPLTFFFLLGVTNAINLADGLDGLAGGTTLLSLSALALLAMTSANPFVGVVAVVIVGAILGFLRFNTHPARVFMGDGGSQILGFSAAVLSVVLTQDPASPLSSALPLLLLGIPIVDTVMVMTQRLLEHRSPFQADRNHIHHRLLALGLDHHEAVVTIYGLQCVLFVVAWFFRYESDLVIGVTFVAFALAVVAFLQLAGASGWRWRRVAPGATTFSPLSGMVQRLRAPEYLPRWALIAIACAVSGFFFAVALACPRPSVDVRVMSVVLATGIGLSLAIRWQAATAGWMEKAALYIVAVMAVYFDRETGTAFAQAPVLEAALFVVLALGVVVRFRLSSDRSFRITPLDMLVIFIALAVPNLPGSIAMPATLGLSIAKLIVLLYGLETLLGAAARWWRLPCLAALGLLVTCAVRGLL